MIKHSRATYDILSLLGDMGGIIVIDFIDMTSPENRKNLFEHFKKEMESDRAKHKVLPPSKIGLIQMTILRFLRTCKISYLRS